jgi:hypothetical protein
MGSPFTRHNGRKLGLGDVHGQSDLTALAVGALVVSYS